MFFRGKSVCNLTFSGKIRHVYMERGIFTFGQFNTKRRYGTIEKKNKIYLRNLSIHRRTGNRGQTCLPVGLLHHRIGSFLTSEIKRKLKVITQLKCLRSRMALHFILVLNCILTVCSTNIVNAAPAAELSPVTIMSIRDASEPEIPLGETYSVVNLNIRESPNLNARLVGKYKKGSKVNVLNVVEDNGWVRTDKGYVWGGYLSSTCNHDLNIHSDSDTASKYVGFTYNIIDQMDEKWINYMSKYEIILCENPTMSYNGTARMETGILANGLMYYSNGVNTREHSSRYHDSVITPRLDARVVTRLNLSADFVYTFRDSRNTGKRNLPAEERKIYLRANTGGIYNTILHELGHIVDFESSCDAELLSDADMVKQSMTTEKEAVREKYNLTEKKLSTSKEYFAEAFRLSIKDPEGLKEDAPIIAEYIETLKK